MRTTIALLTALAATPAMACTNWKAIAAFDAALASYDSIMAGHGLSSDVIAALVEHSNNTMKDRRDALADTSCAAAARPD